MSKDETQLELGTLTGEERELLRAYRAQRVMPELERVRIGAWLEAASQEASQPVRKSAGNMAGH